MLLCCLAICVCTAKEHVSDHLHALHDRLILTHGSGAALAAVGEVVQMSTLGEGSQGGEETAVPAVGGDQQQHSMGQISRIVGKTEVLRRT